MKYYLGLDNGGTNIKAAIFDEDGNEIIVKSKKTSSINEKEGYFELDLENLWKVNTQVIKEAILDSHIDPKDILAISLSGAGKGLYLIGKDDKPLRNGIMSIDSRAKDYALKWKNEGIEKKLYNYTLQHIMSCQQICLLAWLKENERETYDKIKWIFSCKDYIRYRLSKKANSEISDFSGSNLVNLNTKEYDDAILDLLDLKELKDKLPPLCNSSDITGYIDEEISKETSLAINTKVVAGAFDIDACALGAGIVDDNHICMVAGTWAINERIKDKPIIDERVLMNSIYLDGKNYLIEESSPTSAVNNNWLIDNLLKDIKDPFEFERQAIKETEDENDIPIFLPFIYGSNVNANAKGSFVGINSKHNLKHLVRSVFEGVTFTHMYHLEKLFATYDKKIESIRLTGGVTNSKEWSQMFADVTGFKVETIAASESGALGVSILSSVALKQNNSLKDAVNKMVKIKDAYIPNNQKHNEYQRRYQMYKTLILCLDKYWS